MKFINFNSQKIVAVILSGFIIINISGCSKEENYQSKPQETYNQTKYEEPQFEEPKYDEPPFEDSNNKETQYEEPQFNFQPNTSNNNQEVITYSESDEKAIQTFNNLEEEINDILNSETVTNVKDKAKGAFITIVDFLFYNSEINGVTFDELTDSGKQKVLEIASNIDNKIENKFPDYKETISETAKDAFNKASELIKKGANNIKDFSKEKLGEENYNAIIEVKDDIVYYTKEAFDIIGDIGSDLLNNGKEYIKNWYENFKN